MLSPTLETDPALTASTKARLVAVVPGGGAASFLPYPPGLPEDARPAGKSGPDWMEVMSHMALRLTWVDPGFAMDVFAHDAPLDAIVKSAANADVFVVVGVGDGAAAFASASFEARAPKRVAPTSLADAPSAKAPKRVAPTPLS